MMGMTASVAALFPDHEAHSDLSGCLQISQHLGEHLQFGAAVAQQEVVQSVRHLLVQLPVSIDDELTGKIPQKPGTVAP